MSQGFEEIHEALLRVAQGHRQQEEGSWRCPGCNKRFGELPAGHVYTYGDGTSERPGRCCTPPQVAPWEVLDFEGDEGGWRPPAPPF